MILSTSIPAHIIVGSHEQTTAATLAALRTLWCATKNTDCFCATCKQLSHQQHRSLAWLRPTKDYTVDDLAVLFQITSLALDEGQSFFFVLEHAEKLTQATANRLLKNLEEPPPGYHFVLLTDNLSALLPTIISRSEVITLERMVAPAPHPLVGWFVKGAPLESVQDFEQLLWKNKLSDSESIQIFDELFEHFHLQLTQAIKSGSDEQHHLMRVVSYLQATMARPPQSGSSDLFWKQLWVNFPRL
jgi:DNA polymerase-3 subunit delta'